MAEIIDDTKINDSEATYQDDNVEFYFDINNAKATSYDTDDVQYSFAWNDGTTIGTIPSNYSTTDIVYSIIDTENGYIAEVMIPWTTLNGTPQNGDEIGFDFMINDDDNGGDRDAKLSWNATDDQAWQNPSLFGTVKLLSTDVLSVDRILEKNLVSIYPNPSQDILLIEGTDNEFEYKIIDATGRVQLSGKTKKKIKIENLAQGIYFLKLVDGNKKTNMKFIKK